MTLRRRGLNLVVVLVCVLVGLVLLVAGFEKLSAPEEFASAVLQYDVLGPQGSILVSALLPAVELVVGITLLLNVVRDASLLLAAILFFVFVIAQTQALARGIEISCGCFDLSIEGSLTTPELISYGTILRPSALLLLTIGALALLRGNAVEHEASPNV